MEVTSPLGPKTYIEQGLTLLQSQVQVISFGMGLKSIEKCLATSITSCYYCTNGHIFRGQSFCSSKG